ncbi:MAG TPA: hypothetical protein VK502_03800 [Candidatus Saccharimonadales bacterium]|nr:hypothetical protein [Candidatus Saccharimonadales bacterium]
MVKKGKKTVDEVQLSELPSGKIIRIITRHPQNPHVFTLVTVEGARVLGISKRLRGLHVVCDGRAVYSESGSPLKLEVDDLIKTGVVWEYGRSGWIDSPVHTIEILN